MILVTGILQTDKSSDATSYECPLYRYPSRNGSNFIVQLVYHYTVCQYLINVISMNFARICQLKILNRSGYLRGLVHCATWTNSLLPSRNGCVDNYLAFERRCHSLRTFVKTFKMTEPVNISPFFNGDRVLIVITD